MAWYWYPLIYLFGWVLCFAIWFLHNRQQGKNMDDMPDFMCSLVACFLFWWFALLLMLVVALLSPFYKRKKPDEGGEGRGAGNSMP